MTTSTPTAIVKRRRRLSPAWIIPLMAAIFAGYLGWQALAERGTIIRIRFDAGHGIKIGDEVRFRGITVGEVRQVQLDRSLEEVTVSVSLHESARQIATRGTRFWIVRPRLGLSGIEGIETIVGPRYIAVNPDTVGRSGPTVRNFIGLASAPVVESIAPGDLEIVLQADERGSLAPGAPVTYREVRIGTVLSVGLASDGGSIEARVHVEQPYVTLIRERTRFWDAGGVRAELGFTGASVELQSLEAFVTGAVALAPPNAPGGRVHTGHRFALEQEPPEDWLQWNPMIAIGSDLLPAGAPLPRPLRAKLAWTEGRIFRDRESRQGWVLQTPRGLLGPVDLITASGDARDGTTVLEIEGEQIPLNGQPRTAGNRIGLLDASVTTSTWPIDRFSSPADIVDCIAVGDPAATPLALAAARMTADAEDGVWLIDESLPIARDWHGSVVMSRTDGLIIGVLLVEDERTAVSLVRLGDDT